ncbi:MAG: efflux RND transporter periplasmic adaptor subunit [Halieaceae bacterium]|nr:efflux RND transporter periplasmic adaptor subunit [Halieaceae bacterium]
MSRIPVLIPLFLWLLACSPTPQPQRSVEVVVDAVVEKDYQYSTKYIGRLRARDDVAIQALVTGYLMSRDFQEGALVEAGDVLYTIDPSEYAAAMARAQADLAAAIALQANAERNYNRGRELLPRGAISQSEVDDLMAKKLDADAHIEAARALITSAQVNLDYTVITAPIRGRIGRSAASVGDLVGPNTGVLTTLVSIDPIEALFQVSELVFIEIATGTADYSSIASIQNIEVTLELRNGVIYPEIGRIDYIANRIDATTGTLEARASIPNPRRLLVPGQYVRVILTDPTPRQALFIPQASVQADQQGDFVLVVDADNTVRRRGVELGHRDDDRVLVKQGVAEGERVIVRGLQQVRPGMQVEVKSIAGLAAQD